MPDGHVTSTKFWLAGLVSRILQAAVVRHIHNGLFLPFMVISENKQRNTLNKADQFLIYTIRSDFTQNPHQLLPNFSNWFAFYPWYAVSLCIKRFLPCIIHTYPTTSFQSQNVFVELAKCPLFLKVYGLSCRRLRDHNGVDCALPNSVRCSKNVPVSDVSKRKH